MSLKTSGDSPHSHGGALDLQGMIEATNATRDHLIRLQW